MDTAAWTPCCGEHDKRTPAPTDEVGRTRCCEQREFAALGPAVRGADGDPVAAPAEPAGPPPAAFGVVRYASDLRDPLDHAYSGLSPPLRERLSTLRVYLL